MGYGIGSGPGSLKVKAASNAIDIEHLAGEIEAGMLTTLKCRGIDRRE